MGDALQPRRAAPLGVMRTVAEQRKVVTASFCELGDVRAAPRSRPRQCRGVSSRQTSGRLFAREAPVEWLNHDAGARRCGSR
jgi:hypothetical protein